MDRSFRTVKAITVICIILSALFMALIVFCWGGESQILSSDPARPVIGEGMNLCIFPFLLALLASIGAFSLIWMRKKLELLEGRKKDLS